MTNNELKLKLKRVSEGDITAFEEIYNDMKIPIMTVIMRIVNNRETAEDILQELFVKLYNTPPFDVENPRAYIFKAASNLSIDEIRKMKQTVSLEECEETLFSSDTDRGDKIDIERALNRLDIKDKQIVILHINGGLKFREIANILEMPLSTALWKYQKAIGLLREMLSTD